MNTGLQFSFVVFVGMMLLTGPVEAHAQVQKSSPDGFSLQIDRVLHTDPDSAFSKFVNDFSSWYDVSHSYSQNASNLSIDLERHCMFEKLENGGFVRHMEIVFYQPGKVFRMTGGLGPLQGMGVSGALTVNFKEADGKTLMTATYVVSGASFLQLDKIATPVHQVLAGQLTRFENWCNRGDPTPEKAGTQNSSSSKK